MIDIIKDKLYDEIGICNERCKKCVHCGRASMGKGYKTCDYILNTNHRRPCPAGKGCTEFATGKKKRKNIGEL